MGGGFGADFEQALAFLRADVVDGEHQDTDVVVGDQLGDIIALADDLEFPTFWIQERLRWQRAEGVLRELRDYYGLIDIEFRHGTDEWVKINELPGDTFPVALDFFKADFLNSKTSNAKYVYLIKALLKEEGKTLDSYTREELAEKYNINIRSLYRGLKEVK